MSETKHTPTEGPWYAWENKYGWQVSQKSDVARGITGHWLAHMKCESCPAYEEEVARLMAAAPDLLEAAEPFVAMAKSMKERGHWGDGESLLCKNLQRLCDAVAKATGEGDQP